MSKEYRYTTILWDLDGTLLDFLYSQRHALISAFHANGHEIDDAMVARYSAINDSYWKRLELGEVTKDQLLNGRFETLFAEYQITDIDVTTFRKTYEYELGMVYSYLDDSLKLCKTLKGTYRQYIVTNGIAKTQTNKLRLSGFQDVMDGVFISELLGAPKPQKAYFDACLSEIPEKEKSRILLVGDSLTSDIKGGVNAGLPTAWVRPEGSENPFAFSPTYEITHLQELLPILKEPLI